MNSAIQEQKPAIHIESKFLGKTIYVEEISTIHIDDLRNLSHEIEADSDSMAYSIDVFRRKLDSPPEEVREPRDFLIRKLAQISRKASVYSSFLRLVRREINWRLAINAVSRAKLAIKAKDAGLTNEQINCLLNPLTTMNAIHDSESVQPLNRSTAATISQRLSAVRQNMLNSAFYEIVSKEFSAEDLTAMNREAEQKVQSSIDWQHLEAVLTQCLPE